MKINKKGDKLLSIYWFAILVIVATGVVIMVNVYYGSPYDVRQVESGILANHVANCIYFGGEVNPSLISSNGIFKEDFRDHFMNYCTLNFSVEGEFTQIPYYLEINFFKGIDSPTSVFNISEGNQNLKSDCGVDVQDKFKLSKCTSNSFFMKLNSNDVYFVKILAVVSKVNENTN